MNYAFPQAAAFEDAKVFKIYFAVPVPREQRPCHRGARYAFADGAVCFWKIELAEPP